jgi:23S rRNA U2552 (ribose-2'-O)-methylase RlmE/FtsJ
VSRAAWKLVEVFRRRPQFNPSLSKSKRPFVAVDIGASPGGWSYELASMPNCSKVYAVDPGALTKPIPDKVVHLQKKIEECTEELMSQGVKFDCVVCDMNASPRMTIESLLSLSKVVNKGAVIVLTFKNFVGGRKSFAVALKEALALVEGIVVDQDVVRLMSGGVEERTLVGRFA